jgi:hypothetical protein
MHSTSLLRYAGHVSAFGSYGAPTLAGYRLNPRLALFLGLLGALFLISALGLGDHHLLLLAGPVSLLQSNQSEAAELEDERDSIIAAAEGRAANGGDPRSVRRREDTPRLRSTDDSRRSTPRTPARAGALEAPHGAGGRRDRGRRGRDRAVASTATAEAPKPFRSFGEQLAAIRRRRSPPDRRAPDRASSRSTSTTRARWPPPA